jgi:signal transduction histidine kinase
MVSIGQLSAGIAHEINTPIQYIGDNVRFLQGSFADILDFLTMKSENRKIDMNFLCKEVPEAIQQSLDGVERVSSIVKAIKEFSHPNANEKILTDVNRALENSILVSKNEWKYVAQIERLFDPNLPMVSCFPNEMNQVFLNLIVNAAHAIEMKTGKSNPSDKPEKGKITIQTIRENNQIEIRIKDTGMGIKEIHKNKIFEPFFTTKEVGKGTGQGLAIVHSIIVGKHEGKITFDTKEGEGTTVIVRIPL